MTATWITIGIYVAGLVTIGVVTGRSSKSVADITVGGRRMGAWLSALSYGTAYFSAVMFVGYAGSTGYGFGLWGILVGLGNAAFGAMLAWLFLAKRTREISARLGLHTMPELFEKFYGSKAMKLFSCVVIFIFLIPYSASVYMGLGNIAEVLLGIPPTVFMVLIAALAGFLLFFGGYLVQARADFVQGLILMVGMALLIGYVVFAKNVGGFSGIADYAKLHKQLGLTPRNSTGWWALISLIFMTSFGTWGLPHMVQKYFGIKDNDQARRGVWISTIFCTLIAGGGYFIGSLCHKFFTSAEFAALQADKGATFKDYIVPMMLEKAEIPSVLLGVVFVLLMGASVTTLSAIILTACSTLVKDFIGTLKPGIPDKRISLGIKLLCLAFAAMSFFVARAKGSPILDMMGYSWGAISGSFMAPYVFSLYYKKANKYGAWAGILSGFAVALIPATCKVISWFYADPALVPATAAKLMGQSPQFMVIATCCSMAMCFLVNVITRNKAKPVEAPAAAPARA